MNLEDLTDYEREILNALRDPEKGALLYAIMEENDVCQASPA